MKTNIIKVVLLILLFSSCKTPNYIPPQDLIDVNQFGSYIKLGIEEIVNIENEMLVLNEQVFKGELISVNKDSIVVLSDTSNTCVTYKTSKVQWFKLRYAKPKHYGGLIPIFLGLPFIHGRYAILTMPLHLIITIPITVGGEKAFTYNNDNLTFEELKMFARFPQGIPSNINIKTIKYKLQTLPTDTSSTN